MNHIESLQVVTGRQNRSETISCHWRKWRITVNQSLLFLFMVKSNFSTTCKISLFTARLAKRAKVMFSLCVSVHRGGVPIPQCIATLHGPPPAPPPHSPGPGPPGPPPSLGPGPPNKKWTKKMDKVLDKKWTQFWTKNGQNFGQKIGQIFWKLLEVGGAGGTPLAVTQEDCLVVYACQIFNVVHKLG